MSNENIVTPHWQLPFQFTFDGSAVEIEQGSDNEIQQAIYAYLAYQPGQLMCYATFGMPDPTLKKGATNLTAVNNLLVGWDDRVDEIISRDPGWIQTLVDTVTIQRNLVVNA